MENNVQKLLRSLAVQREVVYRLRDMSDKIMEEALAKTNYHNVKSRFLVEAEVLDEIDKQVREIAIEEAKKSGELPSGVTVQNGQEAVIDNENQAREWCMKNFTPALALDVKSFKSAIKAGNIPENLGHMQSVSKVKIASDLSGYVDEKRIYEILSDVK